LNELDGEYKAKGLSIIGVTSEGASDTEKWIAEKGVKYAYGYDKSGKLSNYFGVSGIPHAVLFDASGKVVWDGHPGNLDGATIEKALAGALTKLPWEWDAPLQPAAQLLTKRQFAKAIAEAKKVGSSGEALVTAIQGVVTNRVGAIEAAKTAGDFLLASEDGAELLKDLKGLPEEAALTTLLKDLAADKEAQKVIAAQKQVRDLTAEKIKKRDLPAVLKKLDKIKSDNEGNAAARDASAAIDRLRKSD
jgi:hypothetical protein